jgi:hypothetical protein
MELNLTPEQKLASLQNAQSTLSQEIYNLLLRIGVDPDEFQESDIDSMRASGVDGEILRLEQIIKSLSLVEDKLSVL